MATATNNSKKAVIKETDNKSITMINIPQIPAIEIPIKIIIDVKIKQDGSESQIPVEVEIPGLAKTAEPPPNFEYFFTANGVTIEKLLIISKPFSHPCE